MSYLNLNYYTPVQMSSYAIVANMVLVPHIEMSIPTASASNGNIRLDMTFGHCPITSGTNVALVIQKDGTCEMYEFDEFPQEEYETFEDWIASGEGEGFPSVLSFSTYVCSGDRVDFSFTESAETPGC